MEDNASTINPAKLFVGNLAYTVRDEQLRELFSQYGEIAEATVLLEKQFGQDDGRPRRSRGMGFVTFVNPEDAQKAVEALHDQELEGRKLIVAVAKPRTERSSFDNDRGGNRGGYNNNRGGSRGGYNNNRGGGSRW